MFLPSALITSPPFWIKILAFEVMIADNAIS